MYTLLPTGYRQGAAVGGDFFTFENLINHAHGALPHFPVALLFVSVGLDLFAGKRANWRWGAWMILVLGAVGAVVSTVSGLLAHLAYEDDPFLLSVIEPHQYLAFASTAIFVGLAGWRWYSRRRGSDAGDTRPYLALALAGLVVLGITGLLGGNLVSEWGIGVRNITR